MAIHTFINEYEISISKNVEGFGNSVGDKYKSFVASKNIELSITGPAAGKQNISFASKGVKSNSYSVPVPTHYNLDHASKNVLDGRNNIFKVSDHVNSSQVINLPITQSGGVQVELDDNDAWG
jgi:hypothetical protein